MNCLLAQTKPERARLPSADSLESSLFYQDAFREGLRGERPKTLGAAPTATSATSAQAATPTEDSPEFQWSTIISARTLEEEVKSIQIQLQKSITTPGRFSSGSYLDARRMFTELAALFAVIHQYDRDVRWKSDAALARDLFTRAAANTKTTSIQAFNEAKKRKLDLEEMVRGGNLISDREPQSSNDWSLINRAALMQRFTQSYDEGLAIWTANDRDFSKHASDIQRESELLMMLSRAITQSGAEDADDEDYVAYSRRLEQAANDARQALAGNDYEAARKAASDIGQSCIACHEDYRG